MQIVVGDQLTCKNIRGCKLWRQPEVDPKERLGWAKEMPGGYLLETTVQYCIQVCACSRQSCMVVM